MDSYRGWRTRLQMNESLTQTLSCRLVVSGHVRVNIYMYKYTLNVEQDNSTFMI